MRLAVLLACIGVALSLSPEPSRAQSADVCSAPAADFQAYLEGLQSQIEDRRVAVVLGASNYGPQSGLRALPNALNDARMIAATANYAGYLTICVLNPEKEHIEKIAAFLALHAPGTSPRAVAAGENSQMFFYFAGHGFQIGGRMHILPVNYDPASSISNNAIALVDLLVAFQRAADLVVASVDACRISPPMGSDGPTTAEFGDGTFLQYSSTPGHLASDVGLVADHGAYAPAFTSVAELPGIPLGIVFSNARTRTRDYRLQTPADVLQAAPDDRVFRRATTPDQAFFAQAWIAQHASGKAEQCPILLLRPDARPYLHEALARVALADDDRFRIQFEKFLAGLDDCGAAPAQGRGERTLVMETNSRAGFGVSFSGQTGGAILGDDAYLFLSPEWSEFEGDRANVYAVDPSLRFNGEGSVNLRDLRVAQTNAQVLVRAGDVAQVLARVREMRSPVLYVREPASAAELTELLRTHNRLEAARVEAERNGVSLPQTELQILEGATLQRLIGERSVLVDRSVIDRQYERAVSGDFSQQVLRAD